MVIGEEAAEGGGGMTRSYVNILSECYARSAEFDTLFDQYWALPDRPRPIRMMRATETSPLEPHESIDVEHWEAWYLVHTKMAMPPLPEPRPGLLDRIKRMFRP